MKQLDFRIHDFTRVTWVSDSAKEVWWPRIRQVSDAWLRISCLAAASFGNSCALQVIPPIKLFDLQAKLPHLGLIVEVLDTRGITQPFFSEVPLQVIPGKPFNYNVVIGIPKMVKAVTDAWEKADRVKLYQLSGTPACCIDFWEREKDRPPLLDTTWTMAENTPEANQNGPVCELNLHSRSNTFLRWLGLHLLPHTPCSFNCKATVRQVSELLDIGRGAGYSCEMDWLSEMLSWPFEWSALHGIAEIKTPILKMAATTDAAANKHTVQCKGDSYPEEGAAGVVFPYRKPKRLRVTESAGYRRGLKNPINKVREAGFDVSGNSFDLKVGFSCNNDCIHCVVSDKRFAGDMSTTEIISILGSIHGQYGQITFTGGEPTIRKDFIKLLKKARSSGLRINLQTNGRQFKDRDFATNSAAFLDNILIALHSFDEKQHDLITGKKGSWQETVQGIKNLVSTGRAGIVSSQTVISKSNCDNLVETCRFIDHLGIRHIHITFPHPNGSALVNFDRVVPRYSHIKKILHECFEEFGSRLIIEAVPLCYIHPYVGKVRTVDDEFYLENKRGGIDKSNSGVPDSYFNDKGITENYNEAIISEHRKPQSCTSCIYDKRCTGVWKEYYEAYRENLDLFPVKLETKGTRLN